MNRTKKIKRVIKELKSKRGKRKDEICKYFYECKTHCCIKNKCNFKKKCIVPKNLRDLYIPRSDYIKDTKLYYRGSNIDVLFSMLYLLKKYPKKIKFSTITKSVLEKKKLIKDDLHINWTYKKNKRLLKFNEKLIYNSIDTFFKNSDQQFLIIPLLYTYWYEFKLNFHSNYIILIKMNDQIYCERFDPMGNIMYFEMFDDIVLLDNAIKNLLKKKKYKKKKIKLN